ncbi:hypothetical protein HNP47_000806 [Brevundimonas vesicularis]|uniref:TIR domain-containing protein n=1 Tax=Brevundimonas vesicularis TaxID=41276 RepID=A0A7W9FSM2_BREVE|nr:hypothetical protein [Brevundimonas vesicularis]MBB5770837.1 hypothetical protein [Brevundimonas vesicularis]
MTQAPTPGPLSGDDVKLLVKGDLLMSPNRQHVLRFCRVYEPYDYHDKAGVWLSGDSGKETLIRDTHYGDFNFIGRPDESGWMPWSGGENPVPGRMVEVRWTNGLVEQYYSDIVSWRKGGVMVEAFRLAPTSPVEASGPERETVFDGEAHDLVQTAQALAIAIERVPDWLMNDNLLTAHCHAEVLIADLPAALRPQPSGETRSGVYVASRASVPARGEMWRTLRAGGAPIISTWIDEDGEGQSHDLGELWERILREVNSAERLILYVEPDDFPLKGAFIEVGMALAAGVPVFVVSPGVALDARSLRPLGSWALHPLVTLCQTMGDALHGSKPALLSARPLALGGQQGNDRGRIEAIVREAVIAASVDVPEKFADRAAMRFEITQNATDALVSALSTTPARAEAQDEDTPCTDCGDTGVTHQTERRCSCQEAEAQDEGAAGDLRTILRNVVAHATGGSVLNGDELGLNDICCRITQMRNKVYLAGKDSAHPSPTPAADADRMRIAVEALEPFARRADYWEQVNGKGGSDRAETSHAIGDFKKARQALAALKSEGK